MYYLVLTMLTRSRIKKDKTDRQIGAVTYLYQYSIIILQYLRLVVRFLFKMSNFWTLVEISIKIVSDVCVNNMYKNNQFKWIPYLHAVMWALLFSSTNFNFRTNIAYKCHANVQHRKFAFGRSNLCCLLKILMARTILIIRILF